MKNKLPLSASHLTLYIILLVYIATAIFGMIIAYNFIIEYPDYTVQIIIGLFSFVGVCGTSTIAFYCNKAKAENEMSSANRKYEMRLNLAMQVVKEINAGKLSADGITLAKALISDNETSVLSTGYGGVTVVDEQKFSGVNNPNTFSDANTNIFSNIEEPTLDEILERCNYKGGIKNGYTSTTECIFRQDNSPSDSRYEEN